MRALPAVLTTLTALTVLTVLTTLTALSVHAHAGPPALLVLRSACFRQDLPRLHPIPRATLLSHQGTPYICTYVLDGAVVSTVLTSFLSQTNLT